MRLWLDDAILLNTERACDRANKRIAKGWPVALLGRNSLGVVAYFPPKEKKRSTKRKGQV
jgi:hypothetical protein